MRHALIFLIRLYQRTLSPDHGWFAHRHPHGFCRYYPSCSEYSKQAIGRFGVLKGTWLSLIRVARCNPFAKGGIDPIPTN